MQYNSQSILRLVGGVEQAIALTELRRVEQTPMEKLFLELLAEKAWTEELKALHCDSEKIVIGCDLFPYVHDGRYDGRVITVVEKDGKLPTMTEIAYMVMDALQKEEENTASIMELLLARRRSCDMNRKHLLFNLADKVVEEKVGGLIGDVRDMVYDKAFVFYADSMYLVKIADLKYESPPVYKIKYTRKEFEDHHINDMSLEELLTSSRTEKL